MIVEIDGVRFKLRVDDAGQPYTLKRWRESSNGAWQTGHPHWAMAWARWHKTAPSGRIKRAIETALASMNNGCSASSV